MADIPKSVMGQVFAILHREAKKNPEKGLSRVARQWLWLQSGPRHGMDVFSLSPDALVRRLGDEMVVVDLADEQIYTLSATAARCWELLADGAPREAIPTLLSEEFDVDADTAGRAVDAFMLSLREAGLLRETAS